MFVRSPQEKFWLQFERLLAPFEGNDAVKWKNNRRVKRKEVAEAVLRGCIGGGMRRGDGGCCSGCGMDHHGNRVVLVAMAQWKRVKIGGHDF